MPFEQCLCEANTPRGYLWTANPAGPAITATAATSATATATAIGGCLQLWEYYPSSSSSVRVICSTTTIAAKRCAFARP